MNIALKSRVLNLHESKPPIKNEPHKINIANEQVIQDLDIEKDIYEIIKTGKPIKHTCGRKDIIKNSDMNGLHEEIVDYSENNQMESSFCERYNSLDKDVEVDSYDTVEPDMMMNDFLKSRQGDLTITDNSDKFHNLMKENQNLLKKSLKLKNEIEKLQKENKIMKFKISKEYITRNSNSAVEELKKSNSELQQKVLTLQSENLEKDKNIKILFDILQNIPKKINDFILTQKSKNFGNGILFSKIKDSNTSIGKVPPIPYPTIKLNKLKSGTNHIKVICRIKPDIDNCLSVPTSNTIFLPPFRHFDKGIGYNLNKVFCANATQEDIFNEICPILKYCFTGYNVCVLTYGQSGSGKTHTMLGKSDDPGMIILSVKELLKLSEENSATIYKFYLSILEVYNENIYDLLSSSNDDKLFIPKSKVYLQDNGHSVQIKHVSEAEISNIKELEFYLSKSLKQRTPSGTAKNINSSRSHFLVMIRICGIVKTMNESTNRGVLMLCDLAGSEQIEGLTDKEQAESKFINKSITILSRVLDALYKKLPVIPYRDSKLTHLLKPSLMGNAKCIFIATVRSQLENLIDTNRTLNVAKKVELISFNDNSN